MERSVLLQGAIDACVRLNLQIAWRCPIGTWPYPESLSLPSSQHLASPFPDHRDVLEMSHQPPRCPSGYSAFTAFIASDDELSVYRKFRSLSSRNLLYLQSELRVLEAELEAIDAEDLKEELSSDTPRRVAQCFETLELEQDSTDDLKKRMKLIRRIRELMKDYRT